MAEQTKEKFRYFPFLGFKRLHPVALSIMELDPEKDWHSFAFCWGWWEIYFVVWYKEQEE